jgi:hypothetical protein
MYIGTNPNSEKFLVGTETRFFQPRLATKMFPSTNNAETRKMPSSHSPGELSFSLSPVCGFEAGQCVRKIVERERERERKRMKWLFVWWLCAYGRNPFA